MVIFENYQILLVFPTRWSPKGAMVPKKCVLSETIVRTPENVSLCLIAHFLALSNTSTAFFNFCVFSNFNHFFRNFHVNASFIIFRLFFYFLHVSFILIDTFNYNSIFYLPLIRCYIPFYAIECENSSFSVFIVSMKCKLCHRFKNKAFYCIDSFLNTFTNG